MTWSYSTQANMRQIKTRVIKYTSEARKRSKPGTKRGKKRKRNDTSSDGDSDSTTNSNSEGEKLYSSVHIDDEDDTN